MHKISICPIGAFVAFRNGSALHFEPNKMSFSVFSCLWFLLPIDSSLTLSVSFPLLRFVQEFSTFLSQSFEIFASH